MATSGLGNVRTVLGPDPRDGRGVVASSRRDFMCIMARLNERKDWSSVEPDRGCILKLGGHMPLHMWYLYTICLFLFTSVFGKHDHMTCHMIFHCSSYSGSLPINCCNDLGHL